MYVLLLLVVFLGGGTERDEVELDALRQVHDALDDLDRVLQQNSSRRGGRARVNIKRIVFASLFFFSPPPGPTLKRTLSKSFSILPWLMGLLRLPSSSIRYPSWSTKVTKCRSVSASRAGACSTSTSTGTGRIKQVIRGQSAKKKKKR